MKQSKALNILKTGRNVFLTGAAGAGKTYVLNQYIKYLHEHRIPVAITASTGIAATHMNGVTIHTWSGIGIRDFMGPKDYERLRKKKGMKAKMEKVKVLIIDEISMLHYNQLNLVNEVLKSFKKSPRPFGGVQVVFCGDFFQLPPVGNPGERNADKFAFMSEAWVEAKPHICYLTEQYRQQNDDLNRILNEIRNNQLTAKSLEQLEASKVNAKVADSDAPKLFTHNANVDQINKDCLFQLSTKGQVFEAETKGSKAYVKQLVKSVQTEEDLELKIGAKVMFIRNSYEKGFMNGTLGEVINFSKDEGNPLVQIKSGRIIEVEQERWSIDDEAGNPLATFEQYPLRLAWAITIHKSQGMTLEQAEIDLSKTFEKGQGYVALSRLKSMEGLLLSGFNQRALQLDPLAMKADHRFKELAKEADELFSEEEKEAHATFILQCGGSLEAKPLEKKEVPEPKKKKGKSGKNKTPTHIITKELFEEGLSLADVATARGLKKSTIITHITKITAQFADFDKELFRPDNEMLTQVALGIEEAEKQLAGDEQMGLKAVYSALQGRFSYQEIKLAMLFLEQ